MSIGRAREMQVLQVAFDATRDGHGRLVLVVGEAGIGKTRTAAEFVAGARTAGWESRRPPDLYEGAQVERLGLFSFRPARARLVRSL